MKFVKYKLFWVWDREKEEKWLNDMSSKGLQLVSVGFCKFIFEEGERTEYIYRLDLLENFPSSIESFIYFKSLEETGIEFIGSHLKWAYFRKKAVDGDFVIDSSIQLRKKYYKRIAILFIILLLPNLLFLLYPLVNYISHIHFYNFLNLLVTVLLSTGTYNVCKKINN